MLKWEHIFEKVKLHYYFWRYEQKYWDRDGVYGSSVQIVIKSDVIKI